MQAGRAARKGGKPWALDKAAPLHLGTVYDRDRKKGAISRFVRKSLRQMIAITSFGPAASADVRARFSRKGEKRFNPFTGPTADDIGVVRTVARQFRGSDTMGTSIGLWKAWSASRSKMAGAEPVRRCRGESAFARAPGLACRWVRETAAAKLE
jgi:hypothetical protein